MNQANESEIELIVQGQYDQLADRYDQRWKNYITDTLTFFKAWANLSPDSVILDVACGTGELERLLAAENLHQQIVGVDLSERMLAQARQKLQAFPHINFQLATVRSLPFPDRSFDVVISANSFHYFDDPLTSLQEMRRVLKSDGRLVLLDWCRDGWFCQLCDFILKWIDPAHKQCYTQKELHDLLNAAQFQICRSTRVRLSLFWELMAVEVLKG
ncbi:methyltransferase domain-containing protein [Phormidium tenue FACHB-886]|nr:methyltransferase domain-containing protein [Phormidium tenue FACHB-886]